jgi:hypothetical protein
LKSVRPGEGQDEATKSTQDIRPNIQPHVFPFVIVVL